MRGGPATAIPTDCAGLPAHQRRTPPPLMRWPGTSLPAPPTAGTRRPPTSRAPDPSLHGPTLLPALGAPDLALPASVARARSQGTPPTPRASGMGRCRHRAIHAGAHPAEG
ncbi:uncharacterized protein LOC100381951 [Zea mays]|uniref:Uncharacterized protein n=1 Tax=Zea mays TaxID=4577 RepID=C0P349_MAIZE|nr:uncharacterized protein LOC100381951 [Zea mays]ACN27415.1 unknown [Zea mays]|eukprot:NP_001168195.1 uncharacterized protein LOC100381951 [Zea mays]